MTSTFPAILEECKSSVLSGIDWYGNNWMAYWSDGAWDMSDIVTKCEDITVMFNANSNSPYFTAFPKTFEDTKKYCDEIEITEGKRALEYYSLVNGLLNALVAEGRRLDEQAAAGETQASG
jgi:hypothetical protein